MRYYCETFLLPRWSRSQMRSRVQARNSSAISDALMDGGAVLTLPHSGNWDLAGAWAADEFGSLCTVAERLRPEGVFQKFLKMRRDRGISLMPLTGEGGTYEYLRDHVNQGHLVALLGDRDVARNGMGNQFFGHRAPLPIGAALLAIDTGRPLFTCSTFYERGQLVLDFDDEIIFDRTPVTGRDRLRKAQEVSALALANFERHILAHPENWHQLQPVWPDLVAVKK
jgi:KDO2-lipid IV(A) lauroyltransferase